MPGAAVKDVWVRLGEFRVFVGAHEGFMEREAALNCSWHTILVFDDSALAIAGVVRREMFNDVGL